MSNSPLSHFLAHSRSICASSDSESESTDADPESLLLFFALRTGERERPRLREGRTGEGRTRPEEPTDDADSEEEELERNESESEPESEPPLLELLSPRSESDKLACRRLGRFELRDRRRPERFLLRSERSWSSDLLDAGARDLDRGSRDRLR